MTVLTYAKDERRPPALCEHCGGHHQQTAPCNPDGSRSVPATAESKGVEPMSGETRRELLAIYGAIDACGGVMSAEEIDQGGNYEDGYLLGLQTALMEIDMALNRDMPIDEAWIEEGLKRFRDTRAALTSQASGEG